MADLAKRMAAAEGRLESFETRFASIEQRYERMAALVGNSIAHSGALGGEVLSALSRTEGEFIALRRAVEEMSRTQGSLIRELAEMSKLK